MSEVEGPFIVDAELLYQPIGFRWLHNLGNQEADESERFIGCCEETAHHSGTVLAVTKAIVE